MTVGMRNGVQLLTNSHAGGNVAIGMRGWGFFSAARCHLLFYYESYQPVYAVLVWFTKEVSSIVISLL